jgi:hypothetical protein
LPTTTTRTRSKHSSNGNRPSAREFGLIDPTLEEVVKTARDEYLLKWVTICGGHHTEIEMMTALGDAWEYATQIHRVEGKPWRKPTTELYTQITRYVSYFTLEWLILILYHIDEVWRD